jgi:hypothetical protein
MQRFLDLFISINCSTCFRWFLRPSSGAQNCTYSVRYCHTVTIESNKLLVNLYKRSQGKTYVVKIWVTRRLKGNKLRVTSIAVNLFNLLPFKLPVTQILTTYILPWDLLFVFTSNLFLSLRFDNTWRCMYSFVLLMMGGGTAWNM